MRDLKFRAWADTEVMLYGIMPVTDRVAIRPEASGEDREIWQEFDYMQYIGLKDKNGKEIYEGDIVKWDDQSNGKYWRVAVVEINPDIQFRIIENTLYKLSSTKGKIFNYGRFIYTDTENHLEIVGNIYENWEIVIES